MRKYGWWIGCIFVWLITKNIDPSLRSDILFPFILGAIWSKQKGFFLATAWAVYFSHSLPSLLFRSLVILIAFIPKQISLFLTPFLLSLVYNSMFFTDISYMLLFSFYTSAIIQSGSEKLGQFFCFENAYKCNIEEVYPKNSMLKLTFTERSHKNESDSY